MQRVILMVLIVLACSMCRQRVDNKSFVTTSDGNGNIESEIHYIDDTIKHGTAKYYYTDGKLKGEINYKNGLMDGWYTGYRPDGTLLTKQHYKNGKQDGETYWYDNNGKLEQESNWLNGKNFGDAYFYYPTGILESFRSYDFEGHVRYMIKYDSSGVKTREEGNILGQFLSDTRFNNIPLGKTITAKISVANPPKSTVKVYLSGVFKDTVVHKMEMPVQDNMVLYEAKFKTPGKHTVVTVGELRNNETGLVKRDSIVTDFFVR